MTSCSGHIKFGASTLSCRAGHGMALHLLPAGLQSVCVGTCLFHIVAPACSRVPPLVFNMWDLYMRPDSGRVQRLLRYDSMSGKAPLAACQARDLQMLAQAAHAGLALSVESSPALAGAALHSMTQPCRQQLLRLVGPRGGGAASGCCGLVVRLWIGSKAQLRGFASTSEMRPCLSCKVWGVR